MIAHLRGRLLRKEPQQAVVDVSGVGYRVIIPVSTFYRLGEEGQEVDLRVHTHVREDALQLFGFVSALEQDLFEKLIAVAGVGPKLAINILSGIEVPDLLEALQRADIPRLVCIPGVGRKTAERLALELKDKVKTALSAEAASAQGSPKEDLVSALVHLGYSRAEAERGAERTLRENGNGRFEEQLRRALQVLSGR